MPDFDADRLKGCARFMAGEHGVEKTPEQWRAFCRDLIASYRAAAREAGRHDVAGLPDGRIWDRISTIAEANGS